MTLDKHLVFLRSMLPLRSRHYMQNIARECQLASINKPICQGSYWISVQIQHFKIPTPLSPQEDKAEFQKSPVRGRPNVATSMDIDSTWWYICSFLGIICFDYPASGQQIGSQKADAQHHWWYADGHQPCGVAAVGDFLVVAMGKSVPHAGKLW